MKIVLIYSKRRIDVLAFFLLKFSCATSSKLNLFLFFAIRAMPVNLSFLIVFHNLVLSPHKVENHVKIFFIVPFNKVLSCHKVENHFKIPFILLCKKVSSRHKVENHVKIPFIVLCNQVLSSHKMENHVNMSLDVKIRILIAIFFMSSEGILFKHIDYLIVQLLTYNFPE